MKWLAGNGLGRALNTDVLKKYKLVLRVFILNPSALIKSVRTKTIRSLAYNLLYFT